MITSSARVRRAALAPALALALTLALPAAGWSWGGAVHHWIAEHYSQHLPACLDGLRAYDGVVDQWVTDPDARKSYTPGEAEKHFIDIDAYPEFQAGTLSHDRAALEAEYGAATVTARGVLPWAIDETVTRIADDFRAGQWDASAIAIADLCHYVGDACQPLHCTQNYDGQMTGNDGIHSRYESSMMDLHLADLVATPGVAEPSANAVETAFETISNSWSGVNSILNADDYAVQQSGGPYDDTYFATLWSWAGSGARTRIDRATSLTAALVRTAWIEAGGPVVPGSSGTCPVEPAPVAGVTLSVGPNPFSGAVTLHWSGPGPLTLEVLDVRGRRVETLVDRASGEGTASWAPASGARIAPGIYFVRLRAPGVSLVRRIARLG